MYWYSQEKCRYGRAIDECVRDQVGSLLANCGMKQTATVSVVGPAKSGITELFHI